MDEHRNPDEIAALDDDALLELLRREAAVRDPVPEHVLEAGRASFGWRRLDADLAELLADSDAERRELSGVRGTGLRTLEFASDELTIELTVEIEGAPGRRRLSGQLVPPGPARVEVRHRQGSLAVEAGEDGSFVAEDVPDGRLSVRCEPRSGAPAVETAWISV